MKKILIGEGYQGKLEIPLKSHGFSPIFIPENPNIDKRLASHADLSIFKTGNKLIVAKHLFGDRSFVNELTCCASVLSSTNEQSTIYPLDINLCACVVGKKVIHNKKYTDPMILANMNCQFIHVNQGYAKCMVCVVDDNAIITSDHGIAAAARCAEINVLEIQAGAIQLDGYETGFIGGASFTCGNTIYFTGAMTQHPNCDQISKFILSRNKQPCFLTDDPICDIGGAIVV